MVCHPCEAEARGETGREGRHQAALFYADNGMFVSSDPAWLQGAFTTLVGIFDRVGLMTNVGKTVSMVCHPCQVGPETVQRRHTVGGSRGRGGRTRRDSGNGLNTWSVGNL